MENTENNTKETTNVIKFTEEDLKNLEVVFAMARQSAIRNEDELITIIQFKKQLFEKLKQV